MFHPVYRMKLKCEDEDVDLFAPVRLFSLPDDFHSLSSEEKSEANFCFVSYLRQLT